MDRTNAERRPAALDAGLDQALNWLMALTLKKRINSWLVRSTGYQVTRAVAPPKLHLYEIAKKPKHPLYLNVGAGRWSHPLWHTLDNPDPHYGKSLHSEIAFDLTSGQPWPIETASLAIVYSSHTIEHLSDRYVSQMLSEARRCLRPGGTIRLTTPDMDLICDAYARGDKQFFERWARMRSRGPWEIEQIMVMEFAGPITIYCKNNLPKVNSAEIAKSFSSMPRHEFLDRYAYQIPDSAVRSDPKEHKTWFTGAKLCAMLTEAGFQNARQCRYGQSHNAILRDTGYFDHANPDITLYCEATA